MCLAVLNLQKLSIFRHNKAAAYIHWKTCQHYNIQASDKWYEHEPATVTENKEATILWDMQIHIDRAIAANKPDIVIKDHKNKTCKLIDMAVPSDRNTSLETTIDLSTQHVQANRGGREMFDSIEEASEYWRDLWKREGTGDKRAAWLEEI